MLGGAGCITPDLGYIKGLQEFAQKNDILLILDEIVTGFRLSIGGASQKYNLKPDLFTLGKIVGGGMPIGIVCGKKEVMSLADPVLIKENQARCNIGGGTYSCNPMSMAAGLATINYLNKNRDEIYQKINDLGAKARAGLAKIFKEANIDVQVTGEGSLFLTHFLNNKVRSISNAADVAMSDLGTTPQVPPGINSVASNFFSAVKNGSNILGAHRGRYYSSTRGYTIIGELWDTIFGERFLNGLEQRMTSKTPHDLYYTLYYSTTAIELFRSLQPSLIEKIPSLIKRPTHSNDYS